MSSEVDNRSRIVRRGFMMHVTLRLGFKGQFVEQRIARAGERKQECLVAKGLQKGLQG